MEQMERMYEELFRAMNQFRKLKVGDMMPDISKTDFFMLSTIMDKGEGGKVTTSELAAKLKMLPPAVSRSLKGLEEKGYIERSVNKKDRRNTYVELTPEGERITNEVRQLMCDFGRSVMAQVNEEDVERLILYLNNIYEIAEKEIKIRKKNRKEKEHE